MADPYDIASLQVKLRQAKEVVDYCKRVVGHAQQAGKSCDAADMDKYLHDLNMARMDEELAEIDLKRAGVTL